MSINNNISRGSKYSAGTVLNTFFGRFDRNKVILLLLRLARRKNGDENRLMLSNLWILRSLRPQFILM